MLLMVGQPRGEIWVPIGRKGIVVVEVFALGMVIVARVVTVNLPIVGRGTGSEEMLIGKRGWAEAENWGAVPVGRNGGREVEFRVGNGTRTEGLVAFNVGTGGPPDIGTVLFVPLNDGKGRNPVTGDRGLPVMFTEGSGRRPEAVVFKIGERKRPDTDALKLVVKFTVGIGKKPDFGNVELAVELAVGTGKKPDLGRVEFAVKFAVGQGKKPDLCKVGLAVKFEYGTGRPEIGKMGFAVPLTLGKMPAETERVGKGRAEAGKFGTPVGIRVPGNGYPELGLETVELVTLRNVKGLGNSEIVVVSVVVPVVTVVVPRIS